MWTPAYDARAAKDAGDCLGVKSGKEKMSNIYLKQPSGYARSTGSANLILATKYLQVKHSIT